MPSASDHLKLAQHNADTIQHLLTGEGGFPDWVATVAFYQALHLIEALIHNDFGQHGQNHKHRGDILKRENRYQKINQHYQVLQEASYVARYLKESGGAHYKDFTDYMSMSVVKQELLKTRLGGIRNSVDRLMRGKPKKRR